MEQDHMYGVSPAPVYDKGLATNIIIPIYKKQLELCGFTFVDDSDIIADAGYANNPELIMERMHTTINTWEGVAKITGGTIVHGKDESWWYLINFTWDDKGKR